MNVYHKIIEKFSQGQKQLAVLIDPDKAEEQFLQKICVLSENKGVDFLLIGGSLLMKSNMDFCIAYLKKNCKLPLILFPGNIMQLHQDADAILFISLISGRNPDLLIGKHVIAAPFIKQYHLETIPTGYMLIESGNTTTALYMSGTAAIPQDKPDIAVCTAIAGEMLGLKMIYMDAGSGANIHVGLSMIEQVRKNISLPLIIGGGITDAKIADKVLSAGADIIVIGNIVERKPEIITEIQAVIKNLS